MHATDAKSAESALVQVLFFLETAEQDSGGGGGGGGVYT